MLGDTAEEGTARRLVILACLRVVVWLVEVVVRIELVEVTCV